MIKKCKVIKNNGSIAIALYDSIKVQIPSENVYDDIAYIKYDNNRYTVSNKYEYEKSKTKLIKQPKTKGEDISKIGKIEDKIVIDNEE